ncbi:helix-turn-helix transcriptional regulator [Actinocrispum wychmicini]|uniref:helix-turn-helix transcriptional regulator n=1 Tax=Actinocrispum wychmicini TaxID=1213861 RepID=UPI00104D83DD|nr:AAA family ATPase [Actinocrispum wychmicini]
MPRTGSGVELVGRRAELTRLKAALSVVSAGRAGTVLLSGDAGVGKSRLLTELVQHARSVGTISLTGRCLDVDAAGLPYLPFVEALGQLTSAQRALAGQRPVLARLVPGLAAVERLDENDSAMAQLRLFDSVVGLLTDLAAEAPVLLAIEDLHWADASTRDLVLFLVSRLDSQRIQVVCTLRTEDLHRRHPLRPLLGELSRLSTVETIELAPFDLAHSVEFISALTDNVLPADTVHKIANRSEGNPFFCEELAAAYGDGDGVPSGLAELLLSRVERLSPAARRVVRAISVGSRKVTHSSLHAVCEMADDALEEALREAVQHNVLVAFKGGYTFRHALLREAVYGDLLPGERVRLHAGYANVVTSPASLAYHSLRCHDLPRALAASVTAAHHAAKMYAPGEKLRLVEQALELWTAVPDPAEVSGTTEVSLLRIASTAASAIGEVDRSIEFARSAVAKADETDDPELSAITRHQLATALFVPEKVSAEIEKLVNQAWDLVRDRPPTMARAKILALRAREWVWAWDDDLDIDELRAYAQEAIENARTVGADSVEVDGLVTLAVFAEWTGHTEEAIQVGRTAAERAMSIGAFGVELRAHKNTAITLATAGRLDEAIKLSEFICVRAAEIGLPWGPTSVDARFGLVYFRYYTGDWAGSLAASAVSGVPTSVWAKVTAPSLLVLAAQGEHARLDHLVTELERHTDDPLTTAITHMGQAESALWRGHPHQAVDHIEASFDDLAKLARPAAVDAVLAACIGIWALADIATQARRKGDTAACAQALARGQALVDRMASHRPRHWIARKLYEDNHPGIVMFGHQLAAEMHRLQGTDTADHWQQSVRSATDFPYGEAYARWRWATVLLATGGREEAAQQVVTAHEIASRLGATPLRDAVAALARRGRIPLPGVAEEPPDTELTPRELAVVELAATGMTNREIGTQLYISQKTASVHLSRAMAKLGAANRAEVVSIAHDLGLLS